MHLWRCTGLSQATILSTRVLVNSVALSASYSEFQTMSVNPISIVMTGNFPFDVKKGNVSVELQWRVRGEKHRWRTDPTFLDGFASGRILAVLSPQSQESNFQVASNDTLKDPFQWNDVPRGMVINRLKDSGAFLIGYTLVPKGVRGKDIFKAMLAFRLTIDDTELSRTGTQFTVDTQHLQSITVKTAQYPVVAGTHTIRLQVKALDPSLFFGFDDIVDDILRIFEVKVLYSDILAPNAPPEIIHERMGTPLVTLENYQLDLSGLFFKDPDQNLITDMPISVGICLVFGAIQELNVSSSCFNITDSIQDVNTRIRTLTYIPPRHFFGVETLQIEVTDLGNVGSGGPLEDKLNLSIEVVPVNDPVEMTVANEISTDEGQIIRLPTLSISDKDVSASHNFENLPRVNYSLSILALDQGQLLLHEKKFKYLQTSGELDTLENFMREVSYEPPPGNILQIQPQISVKVCDNGFFGVASEVIDENPRKQRINLCNETIIKVKIVPVNDAPIIAPPDRQIMGMDVGRFGGPLRITSASGAAVSVDEVEVSSFLRAKDSIEKVIAKSTVLLEQPSSTTGWTALRVVDESKGNSSVDLFLRLGLRDNDMVIQRGLVTPKSDDNEITVEVQPLPRTKLSFYCAILSKLDLSLVMFNAQIYNSSFVRCLISPKSLWEITGTSELYLALTDNTTVWSNFVLLQIAEDPEVISVSPASVFSGNLLTIGVKSPLSGGLQVYCSFEDHEMNSYIQQASRLANMFATCAVPVIENNETFQFMRVGLTYDTSKNPGSFNTFAVKFDQTKVEGLEIRTTSTETVGAFSGRFSQSTSYHCFIDQHNRTSALLINVLPNLIQCHFQQRLNTAQSTLCLATEVYQFCLNSIVKVAPIVHFIEQDSVPLSDLIKLSVVGEHFRKEEVTGLLKIQFASRFISVDPSFTAMTYGGVEFHFKPWGAILLAKEPVRAYLCIGEKTFHPLGTTLKLMLVPRPVIHMAQMDGSTALVFGDNLPRYPNCMCTTRVNNTSKSFLCGESSHTHVKCELHSTDTDGNFDVLVSSSGTVNSSWFRIPRVMTPVVDQVIVGSRHIDVAGANFLGHFGIMCESDNMSMLAFIHNDSALSCPNVFSQDGPLTVHYGGNMLKQISPDTTFSGHMPSATCRTSYGKIFSPCAADIFATLSGSKPDNHIFLLNTLMPLYRNLISQEFGMKTVPENSRKNENLDNIFPEIVEIKPQQLIFQNQMKIWIYLKSPVFLQGLQFWVNQSICHTAVLSETEVVCYFTGVLPGISRLGIGIGGQLLETTLITVNLFYPIVSGSLSHVQEQGRSRIVGEQWKGLSKEQNIQCVVEAKNHEEVVNVPFTFATTESFTCFLNQTLTVGVWDVIIVLDGETYISMETFEVEMTPVVINTNITRILAAKHVVMFEGKHLSFRTVLSCKSFDGRPILELKGRNLIQNTLVYVLPSVEIGMYECYLSNGMSSSAMINFTVVPMPTVHIAPLQIVRGGFMPLTIESRITPKSCRFDKSQVSNVYRVVKGSEEHQALYECLAPSSAVGNFTIDISFSPSTEFFALNDTLQVFQRPTITRSDVLTEYKALARESMTIVFSGTDLHPGATYRCLLEYEQRLIDVQGRWNNDTVECPVDIDPLITQFKVYLKLSDETIFKKWFDIAPQPVLNEVQAAVVVASLTKTFLVRGYHLNQRVPLNCYLQKGNVSTLLPAVAIDLESVECHVDKKISAGVYNLSVYYPRLRLHSGKTRLRIVDKETVKNVSVYKGKNTAVGDVVVVIDNLDAKRSYSCAIGNQVIIGSVLNDTSVLCSQAYLLEDDISSSFRFCVNDLCESCDRENFHLHEILENDEDHNSISCDQTQDLPAVLYGFTLRPASKNEIISLRISTQASRLNCIFENGFTTPAANIFGEQWLCSVPDQPEKFLGLQLPDNLSDIVSPNNCNHTDSGCSLPMIQYPILNSTMEVMRENILEIYNKGRKSTMVSFVDPLEIVNEVSSSVFVQLGNEDYRGGECVFSCLPSTSENRTAALVISQGGILCNVFCGKGTTALDLRVRVANQEESETFRIRALDIFPLQLKTKCIRGGSSSVNVTHSANITFMSPICYIDGQPVKGYSSSLNTVACPISAVHQTVREVHLRFSPFEAGHAGFSLGYVAILPQLTKELVTINEADVGSMDILIQADDCLPLYCQVESREDIEFRKLQRSERFNISHAVCSFTMLSGLDDLSLLIQSGDSYLKLNLTQSNTSDKYAIESVSPERILSSYEGKLSVALTKSIVGTDIRCEFQSPVGIIRATGHRLSSTYIACNPVSLPFGTTRVKLLIDGFSTNFLQVHVIKNPRLFLASADSALSENSIELYGSNFVEGVLVCHICGNIFPAKFKSDKSIHCTLAEERGVYVGCQVALEYIEPPGFAIGLATLSASEGRCVVRKILDTAESLQVADIRDFDNITGLTCTVEDTVRSPVTLNSQLMCELPSSLTNEAKDIMIHLDDDSGTTLLCINVDVVPHPDIVAITPDVLLIAQNNTAILQGYPFFQGVQYHIFLVHGSEKTDIACFFMSETQLTCEFWPVHLGLHYVGIENVPVKLKPSINFLVVEPPRVFQVEESCSSDCQISVAFSGRQLCENRPFLCVGEGDIAVPPLLSGDCTVIRCQFLQLSVRHVALHFRTGRVHNSGVLTRECCTENFSEPNQKISHLPHDISVAHLTKISTEQESSRQLSLYIEGVNLSGIKNSTCVITGDDQIESSSPSSVLADSLLRCNYIGLLPGEYNLTLYSDGISRSNTLVFTLDFYPSFSSFTPSFVSDDGTDVVLFRGANLNPTRRFFCDFGGPIVQGMVLNSTCLLCPVPTLQQQVVSLSIIFSKVKLEMDQPLHIINASMKVMNALAVGMEGQVLEFDCPSCFQFPGPLFCELNKMRSLVRPKEGERYSCNVSSLPEVRQDFKLQIVDFEYRVLPPTSYVSAVPYPVIWDYFPKTLPRENEVSFVIDGIFKEGMNFTCRLGENWCSSILTSASTLSCHCRQSSEELAKLPLELYLDFQQLMIISMLPRELYPVVTDVESTNKAAVLQLTINGKHFPQYGMTCLMNNRTSYDSLCPVETVCGCQFFVTDKVSVTVDIFVKDQFLFRYEHTVPESLDISLDTTLHHESSVLEPIVDGVSSKKYGNQLEVNFHFRSYNTCEWSCCIRTECVTATILAKTQGFCKLSERKQNDSLIEIFCDVEKIGGFPMNPEDFTEADQIFIDSLAPFSLSKVHWSKDTPPLETLECYSDDNYLGTVTVHPTKITCNPTNEKLVLKSMSSLSSALITARASSGRVAASRNAVYTREPMLANNFQVFVPAGHLTPVEVNGMFHSVDKIFCVVDSKTIRPSVFSNESIVCNLQLEPGRHQLNIAYQVGSKILFAKELVVSSVPAIQIQRVQQVRCSESETELFLEVSELPTGIRPLCLVNGEFFVANVHNPQKVVCKITTVQNAMNISIGVFHHSFLPLSRVILLNKLKIPQIRIFNSTVLYENVERNITFVFDQSVDAVAISDGSKDSLGRMAGQCSATSDSSFHCRLRLTGRCTIRASVLLELKSQYGIVRITRNIPCLPEISLFQLSPVAVRKHTNIVIHGNNLVQGARQYCIFEGESGRSSTSATCLSSKIIHCMVPNIPPGMYDVSLSDDDGSITTDRLRTTMLYVPRLISCDPCSAPVTGNTTITLLGQGFSVTDQLYCRFGLHVVKAYVHNSQKLSCLSPRVNLAQRLNLTVSSDTDIDGKLDFRIFKPPSLLSVSPTEISFGVETNLSIRLSSSVEMQSVKCMFLSDSDKNEITVTGIVEESLNLVQCPLKVTQQLQKSNDERSHMNIAISFDNGNTYNRAAGRIFMQTAPEIWSISPNSGPSTGSTTVKVVGRKFSPSLELRCQFGTKQVVPQFITSEEINCRSPSSNTNTKVPFVVVFGQGMAKQVLSFTYYFREHVEKVDPSQVSNDGSDTILVEGSNFLNSPQLSCRLGGLKLSATFVSRSAVMCLVPVHPNGRFSLSVSNNGQSFVDSNVEIEIVSAASVTGLLPSLVASSGGASVIVKGSNFRNSSLLICSVGSIRVPCTLSSSNRIFMTSPTSPTGLPESFAVEISFNGRDFTSNYQQLHFYLTPRVLKISPGVFWVNEENMVQVVGRNFLSTRELRCKLTALSGNESSLITRGEYLSASRVNCAVPPLSHGVFFVQLSLNGRDYYPFFLENSQDISIERLYPNLVIETAPAIDVQKVSPKSRVVFPGSFVLLRANGLPKRGEMHVLCYMGASISHGIILGESIIQCAVPSVKLSGTIRLHVSLNGQQISEIFELTVATPPTIDSISPKYLLIDQATNILVTGKFPHLAVTDCRFSGGLSRLSYVTKSELLDNSTLRCTGPTLDQFKNATGMDFPIFVQGDLFDNTFNFPAVRLRITVNGIVFSPNAQELQFISSPILMAVEPSLWIEDHLGVTLLKGSFPLRLTGLFCMVKPKDANLSPSTEVLVMIETTAKASCNFTGVNLAPGEYELSISSEGITGSFGAIDLQVATKPKLREIKPSYLSRSQYTLLTVFGSNFLARQIATTNRLSSTSIPAVWKCHDEENSFFASAVSDQELRCHIPPQRAELVRLRLSVNDVLLIDLFELPVAKEEQVLSVRPDRFATSHVDASVVISRGHRIPVSCIIGNTMSVLERCLYEEDTTVCNCKMMLPMSVVPEQEKLLPFYVQFDDGGHSDNAVIVAIDGAPVITHVDTTNLGRNNSGLVRVVGVGFSNKGSLECAFALGEHISMFAKPIVISSKEIFCPFDADSFTKTQFRGPTEEARGSSKFRVGVTNDNSSIVWHDHLLPLFSVFSLIGLAPDKGDFQGGTVLTIQSSKFVGETAICVFDQREVPATIVASEMIQCIAPPARDLSQNFTNVSVWVDGYLSQNSLAYTYFPFVEIWSIAPHSGPIKGNTKVNLAFTVKESFEYVFCSFGSQIVKAFIEEEEFYCLSPEARNAGTVDLTVSLDGQIFSAHAVTYTYYEVPIIADIQPREIWSGRPVRIEVSGLRFFQSNILVCNFNGIQLLGRVHMGRVLCTIPSLPPSEDVISLSFNSQNQDSTSPFTLRVLPHPKVDSVSPTTLDQSKGGDIFIKGEHFQPGQWSCLLGGIKIPALWLNFNVLMCSMPPNPIVTNMSVKVELSGVGILETGAVVKMKSAGKPAESHFVKYGLFGGDSRNDVLRTSVDGGMTQSLGCNLGDLQLETLRREKYKKAESAEFVCGLQQELAMLTTNPFILALSYPDASRSLTFEVKVKQTPIFSGVEPVVVSSVGDSVLRLTGENFPLYGVSCVIGESTVVPMVLNSMLIKCRVPGRVPGVVSLAVKLPDHSVLPTGYHVEYRSPPQIFDMFPLSGPITGGTLVTVNGSGFSRWHNVTCNFGEVSTPAVQVPSSSTLSCLSPPFISPKATRFTVSVEEISSPAAPAPFVYTINPIIRQSIPSVISSGIRSTILVLGYFSPHDETSYSRCRLGAHTLPMSVLSLTALECVANLPEDVEEFSSPLEVTFNGLDFFTAGISITVSPPIKIVEVSPDSGRVSGKTVVTVLGRGFKNSLFLSCRFDNVVVPARFTDSTTISCASPANIPGNAKLSVSNNALSFSNTLNFTYHEDASVFSLSPSQTLLTGQLPIFVRGAHFRDTPSLRCSFSEVVGVRSVRAVFLSTSLIMCPSPSQILQGSSDGSSLVVPLEVTNNGLDFTNSGNEFVFLNMCPPGSYCNHLEILPAPNGTFAPGRGNTNYTFCPPSTFQPRSGQTRCLPCPIGYFCPDFGMAQPVICSAGYVCDKKALVTPYRPCIPGHYCLTGTKSNDPTDFELDNVQYGEDPYSWISLSNAQLLFDESSINEREIRSSYPEEGVSILRWTTVEDTLAERAFPCLEGHYCRSGVASNQPSLKNFSTPQKCLDGFFCPQGSTSPEGSGPCPTGHFCPGGFRAFVCPIRAYCPSVGNLAPRPCDPGTYNPFERKSQCILCPKGHNCPESEMREPFICPAGFVCNERGLIVPTIRCPAGYICDAGTAILPSELANEGLRRMLLSEESVRQEILLELLEIPNSSTIRIMEAANLVGTQCPAGTFCLGGVASNKTLPALPIFGMKGLQSPQECPDGKFCGIGTTSSTGSASCPPGHACPRGAVEPIQSPKGTFASGLGSVAPSLCFPGTYAPVEGHDQCRICPAGFSCEGFGTYRPTICPKGTYRSLADRASCRVCPPGTFSDRLGATSITDCQPCPPGRICGQAQTTDLGEHSMSCPEGFVCGRFTTFDSMFDHTCPAGYFCFEETVPGKQLEHMCDKGNYCLRATRAFVSNRNKCFVNHFCPFGTADPRSPETTCPQGTSAASGSSSLLQCQISPINVCDKSPLRRYLDTFEYVSGGTRRVINDESLVVQVQRIVDPVNVSRSDEAWQNDTAHLEELCPIGIDQASEQGSEKVTVTGINFGGLFPAPPICHFETQDAQWSFNTAGEKISDVVMQCPLPSSEFPSQVNSILLSVHAIGSSRLSNKLEFRLDTDDDTEEEECLRLASEAGEPDLVIPQIFSELPKKMRWYQLTGLSTARIHFDFSHISREVVYGEHFSIAIFVTPSVCVNSQCDERRELIPNVEENEKILETSPCVEPIELSPWFESNDIDKHSQLDLTVTALEDVLMHIEVHILHGLYITVAEELFNTSSVTIATPTRAVGFLGAREKEFRTLAEHVTSQSKLHVKEFTFAAVFTRGSLSRIAAPFNMPPRFRELERGRVLTGFNSSEGQPWVLLPAESLQLGPEYWEPPRGELLESISKYREVWHEVDTDRADPQYKFERLLLPYFPYISSCREFDSYIPIADFSEDGFKCELPPDNYVSQSRKKFAPLPHPDDIKVVGPGNIFGTPVADTCYRSLQCKYEEDIATVEAQPRWFEVDTGENLFDIIRRPISLSEFFDNGNTIDQIRDEVGIDAFIPVTADRSAARSELRSHCGRQCFPRDVTFEMEYYQMTLFRKRLIRANVIFKEFDRDSEIRDYKFNLVMFPLNWLQLVINFAFDRGTFLSIFAVVAAITLGTVMIYWAIHRLLTRQAAPPKFRFFSFWSVVIPAPMVGYAFSMIPITLIIAFFYIMINGSEFTKAGEEDVGFTGFENIVGHWMHTSVDIRTVDSVRSGRIGFCFFMVAFYLLVVGSRLLVPRIVSKKEKLNLQKPSTEGRVSIWHPTTWKRNNIVLLSLLIAMFLVFVVEFSFWRNYGRYIWYFIVVLKIAERFIGALLGAYLREYLLMLPMLASINVIVSLVTLGANDFADFLLAYAIEYGLMIAERVYVGPGADAIQAWTVHTVYRIKFAIVNFVKQRTRLSLKQEIDLEAQQARELQQLLLKPKAIEGEETVEPILSALGDYTSDLVALFFYPFLVGLLIVFRDDVKIPDLYNIRAQDIEFYLWFALVVFGFQLAADMFLHNVLELVHGWKIHDYLVYVRYRFLQRETRWKGMEEKLDECIDESMRSLDQMCFSSQFYLIMFVHTSGIIFIIFGVEIMIRAEYNMFGDPAIFLLMPLTLIFIFLLKHLLVFLANIFGIWRLRDKDSTPWVSDMDQAKDTWNTPDIEELLAKAGEGKTKYNTWIMNRRLATETFRFKFLDYNRAWLISVLPKILTPRTLARSRPYLLAQFAQMLEDYEHADDSSGDGGMPVKHFGSVELNDSGKEIMRMWLENARKSLQMRDSVLGTINAAKASLQAKQHQRKDIEMEKSIDELANAWKAQHPEDYDSFDLRKWKEFFNKNQRYRPVPLGSSGPRVVGSPMFLQSEYQRIKPTAPPVRRTKPSFPPVQLSPATRAIANYWYTRAKKSLKAPRSSRRPKPISPSTAAIARTWLSMVRRP